MRKCAAVVAFVVLAASALEGDGREEKLIVLTGCVRGFAQGGYFFSDVIDKNGKLKNYLLVNNNEELKQFTGKLVKVAGIPAPFSWTVKYKTDDNRTLKTGNVFGVDTVEVVQPTCQQSVQP
jgi:hypothetical protein